VRLGTWLGQVGNRGVVTGDALGDELQRIERSNERELTARWSGARRSGSCAPCCCEKREHACEDAQPSKPNRHENHFH
jgi:hypothetical protein